MTILPTPTESRINSEVTMPTIAAAEPEAHAGHDGGHGIRDRMIRQKTIEREAPKECAISTRERSDSRIPVTTLIAI